MNPRAGGAEHLTLEIARRLVQAGDSVEWFSATFAGAPREEIVDGIRFVRSGRQWTVHLQAIRRYRARVAAEFDVVVDQINTIPFLTPFWAPLSVAFIHQLAREVWWYESPFPISALGFALEPLYLRFYRKCKVLTVSNSTRSDLLRFGFEDVDVIPEGVEQPDPGASQRSRESPSFLYVGRIAPSKRVSDLIRALALFKRSVSGGQLWLIGDGAPRYVQRLKRLSTSLGIATSVHFLGRLPASDKHEHMATSYATLLASVREGWGLVVTEANTFGTPAITYDVPGLRDSVQDGVTGLLVEPTPKAMAEAMVRLWEDRALHQGLSQAALAWSHQFTFARCADVFRAYLDHLVSVPNARPSVEAPSTR